jgi:tetratricopeptide (TPR) repeat protein
MGNNVWLRPPDKTVGPVEGHAPSWPSASRERRRSSRRPTLQTHLLLAACSLCVLVTCGCKSIRGVRVESQQPLALTAEEAAKARQEGLALWAVQPRDLKRVTDAAHHLEQAARTLRDDYDVQCDAAQALAFVAEYETNSMARRDAAKSGIVLTRQARELKPDGVAGHYWYAINVGLLADADRMYGIRAVGEMEPALKRGIELDERYDLAGPLRVLGILLLRTPGPPTSIGSPRKGLRLLQRAVELFPDYPENYLYLAEALRENRRPDDARAALSKVLDAPPWPDQQFESSQWKADAQKLLKTLPSP